MSRGNAHRSACNAQHHYIHSTEKIHIIKPALSLQQRPNVVSLFSMRRALERSKQGSENDV